MSHLEKAFQLKKELDSLRPLNAEDEQRIMQKFRLDWNYHSNHLEGNSLSYGETKALILFGITAQGKPLHDHIEMTGHNDAIKWIEDIVKEKRPLTENFIRELHKLILKESYEVDAITPDGKPSKRTIKIGEYKTSPNHVKTKTGEIFRFATPEETPAMMNDLIVWYRKKMEGTDPNPILIAAEFHYKFIRIHPFDDGNGRTARVLMNFILMQSAYPPVIIKTEDKENYFAALRQADAGIITPFIDYITVNLHYSLELMISGAKGEKIEEDDDLDKEIALLEQEFKRRGTKVDITKNDTSIKALIEKSINKLSLAFLKSSNRFASFYVDTKYSFSLNGIQHILNEEGLNKKILSDVNEEYDEIQIGCRFRFLNRSEFQGMSYHSKIDIRFNSVFYGLKTSDKTISLQKLYNEQLTEEEIKTLVNHEAKLHKIFIQQQIKESQNTK